jgi:hypothetical protein
VLAVVPSTFWLRTSRNPVHTPSVPRNIEPFGAALDRVMAVAGSGSEAMRTRPHCALWPAQQLLGRSAEDPGLLRLGDLVAVE